MAPDLLPEVVDERGLAQFRAAWLHPSELTSLVKHHHYVLVALPVGTGKTYAVDALLADQDTYKNYDLVVYLAATKAILDERPIIRGELQAPVEWRRLTARPSARCGTRHADWLKFERAGCIAAGKAELCKPCPHRTGRNACPWPARFSGLEGVGLVAATEQHAVVNRNLLLILKGLTGAKRALVILDEAKLLDTSFEIKLEVDQLRRFDEGLLELAEREPRAANMIARWRDSIRTLLATDDETVRDTGWQFPGGLQRYAAQIQKIGLQLDGARYRYLAYDLQLFAGSRTDERWRDASGAIHFTARPYLGNDLLVLSGHLKSTYVTARLGLAKPIASPFEAVRFQHSGTRVFNLRSRIGAEKYFPKNRVQILDLIAVLIFRNVALGRTTVLVTRKKFKETCAKELTGRLEQLGLKVAFEIDLAPHHINPDPRIVPLLHYGIRGMNRYQEYDACYCVNSYFVPAAAVSAALQDEVPDRYRVHLAIRTDESATRRAVVLDEAYAGAGIDAIAQAYLHKLEIEPALQAAGRVRFFTRPREVLFMQLADLSPDVPGVRDVRSLEQLREHLGVPTFGDLRRAFEVRALRHHIDRGASVRQAAEAVGVDKQTARRRLSDQRLNTPLSFLQRYSEPLPGAAA